MNFELELVPLIPCSSARLTGSVICTSCGVLVGVSDDGLLQLRAPESRAVGLSRPALRRLGQDLGFVPLVIGAARSRSTSCRCCSQGRRIGMRPMLVARVRRRVLFLLGASGALSGVPVRRPMVDGAHRQLAPRQGSCTWCFNVMWIRQLAPAVAELFGAGAHGDHLHGRRASSGFTVTLGRGAAIIGLLPDDWRRAAVLGRGIGAHFRPAGRAGATTGNRTGSSHVRVRLGCSTRCSWACSA